MAKETIWIAALFIEGTAYEFGYYTSPGQLWDDVSDDLQTPLKGIQENMDEATYDDQPVFLYNTKEDFMRTLWKESKNPIDHILLVPHDADENDTHITRVYAHRVPVNTYNPRS